MCKKRENMRNIIITVILAASSFCFAHKNMLMIYRTGTCRLFKEFTKSPHTGNSESLLKAAQNNPHLVQTTINNLTLLNHQLIQRSLPTTAIRHRIDLLEKSLERAFYLPKKQ